MNSPGSYPGSVLVDSGAWLALSDSRDDNHLTALAIQQELATYRPRLYTTNFLVDETYTLIRARLNHRSAVRFLDDIYASSLTHIRITPDDEARAEALLRRYDDKKFSYTDATSFVIMERLGIEAAFTFDHNFTEYGRLHVLTPQGGAGNR